MGFVESNGLKYYQFESLKDFPLVKAVFTRHGGVSPEPHDSLNLGGNIGDTDDHIIENKRRIFASLAIPFESQFDVWQVHGTNVIIPNGPRKPLQPYEQADAILTDSSDLTLVMRFADCVPILLYEPQKHIAGIVHAGWQGTVKNTVGAAIKKMVASYGVKENNILAAIGPSIGPDHYSVRNDVVEPIKKRFGSKWQEMIQFKEDQAFLNLWKANEINLQESGINQIEISEICTACHTNDWYSHRAEYGNTGRFGALIKLVG
jgi:YfiH family protein